MAEEKVPEVLRKELAEGAVEIRFIVYPAKLTNPASLLVQQVRAVRDYADALELRLAVMATVTPPPELDS